LWRVKSKEKFVKSLLKVRGKVCASFLVPFIERVLLVYDTIILVCGPPQLYSLC